MSPGDWLALFLLAMLLALGGIIDLLLNVEGFPTFSAALGKLAQVVPGLRWLVAAAFAGLWWHLFG